MSEILNNIWSTLSNDNMTQSSFEDWQSNFFESPDVQSNVYNYLVENNLTQSSGEEWVENINKELAAKQPKVEEEPETEDARREKAFNTAMSPNIPGELNLIPGFRAKAFVGIDNTFKMVKDLFTDEQEREETAEVIVNEINNLKPRALNTFFNKLPAYGMDFSQKIFEATREIPGLKKLQDTLIKIGRAHV